MPVTARFLSSSQRIEAVLRRLDHDGIGDAVPGIEPEGRRDLEAGGQIDHQAVGDVALGDAGEPGAGAVHVNAEFGIMRGLLQPHIGGAGNPAMRRVSSGGIGFAFLPCRAPVTCTSMGAGEPKFRIWLTISAGRKEKVEPGKLCGNTMRNFLT